MVDGTQNDDLINSAARGAAIISGHPKASYAHLAKLLGVGRSQVTRWVAGQTSPAATHEEALQALARLAAEVHELKQKAERELMGLNESHIPLPAAQLHQLDGMSHRQLEQTNPLAAEEVWTLVERRRARRQCDLCGGRIPRAAYPAGKVPERPHRYIVRYVNTIIGAYACAPCVRKVSSAD